MNKSSKNSSVKEILKLPVRIYIYYFLSVFSFCYLYFHKFVQKADLYSTLEPGGILTVLNFESFAPIQYRILTAFLYKIFSLFFFFLGPKAVYFILIVFSTFLAITVFYLLLNKYFIDKNLNAWIAPVILYPLCWNLIILNGQFFHYDFTLIFIMVLGYYLVINNNKFWLILLTAAGTANHDTIVFVIAAYFIYNFFRMKKPSYFIFFLIYLLIYVSGMLALQYIFRNNPSDYASQVPGADHFFFLKIFMNLRPFVELPLHIILRDILLNFGGLLGLTVLMIRNTRYINLKHKMVYLFWLIPLYILAVIFRAGIEEMRNYIAITPLVTLLFLMYFSRLRNSFLKPVPEVLHNGK